MSIPVSNPGDPLPLRWLLRLLLTWNCSLVLRSRRWHWRRLPCSTCCRLLGCRISWFRHRLPSRRVCASSPRLLVVCDLDVHVHVDVVVDVGVGCYLLPVAVNHCRHQYHCRRGGLVDAAAAAPPDQPLADRTFDRVLIDLNLFPLALFYQFK